VGGSLDTPHLTLLRCAPEHLLTLIDQPERFEQVVGVPVADELQGFYVSDDVSPAWLAALRSSSGPDPWRHGFFVVHREEASIIGSAEFKGPLVQFAFASGQVRLVQAHTLPETNASTRVLVKCGFHHVGMVVDPEDGPVWRWERGPSPL